MPSSLAKQSTSLATDRTALLSLKSHITSDPSGILARNWTGSSSVCSWIGVTCSLRHQRVAALNLSYMTLSATIPPQLGHLSFLVSVDLTSNLFSGTLPRELSLLRRLKLVFLRFNNFTGDIPSLFGQLPKLEYLNLRNNTFTGSIPKSLSNLTNLKTLNLISNSLSGEIPQELGRLQSLQNQWIDSNHLSGALPPTIFNISALASIAFTFNELSGSLPTSMCRSNLPFLVGIYLSYNQLSGQIPTNLSQCSRLQELSLSYNSFSGRIPAEIGYLTSLQALYLGGNNLNGILPHEIGNLQNLVLFAVEKNEIEGSVDFSIFMNMSSLQILNLGRNKLTGNLSREVGNLTILTRLELSENYFTGLLPIDFGRLYQLKKLGLGSNNMSGSIPHELFNISTLQTLSLNANALSGALPTHICHGSSILEELYLGTNSLSGPIPNSISNCSQLTNLALGANKFSGYIPTDLGNLRLLERLRLFNNNLTHAPSSSDLSFITSLTNCRSLTYLSIGDNPLYGIIPTSVGNLSSSLQQFYAYNCKFGGSIPIEIDNLSNLIILSLHRNELSGDIPLSIRHLNELQGLSLYDNMLGGSIPEAICDLYILNAMYISQNQVSGPKHDKFGKSRLVLQQPPGSIPKSLETLQHLDYFNVSFNSLRGEIPTGGRFRNFTMGSFQGNEALCGIPAFHVQICPTLTYHRSKRKKVELVLFIVFGAVALITVVYLAFIFVRYKKKDTATSRIDELISIVLERIAYYELLQATEQFNDSNLLGIGSSCSVYKGILNNGKVVAVKVFNMQLEGISRRFDVECQILRSIRHRNLTSVISSSSNEEFKALVLEYMPKGNLEKWLYSHNYCLNLMERLNIMIDVASALEYLHYGYSTPIVHNDLKPSNVLLDEDMVAHVSDFGIAKLLGDRDSFVVTNNLATLGYIAPEYGLEGLVSTRSDVYSYGVMLIETFTRKRPSDDIFVGDLSLKTWVEISLPDMVDEVIDANLLMYLEKEELNKNLQCVSSILVLALKCSADTLGIELA